MASWTQQYGDDGKLTGVVLHMDDGRTRTAPAFNIGNSDWRDFLAWNSKQVPPLDLNDKVPPLKRRPRTVSAIIADLKAIPGADLPGSLNTLRLKQLAMTIRANPTFATDEGIDVPGDELG